MTDDKDNKDLRPAPAEAAGKAPQQPAKAGDGARKPALRLVHSAASDPLPQGQVVKIRHSRNDDDDDPGPSAA